MVKIRNFDSFGAVFPHFCPDKREIWHGEALNNNNNTSIIKTLYDYNINVIHQPPEIDVHGYIEVIGHSMHPVISQ